MSSTERRMGSARRGMTVLGKIPAAPKPINLPSQRLENQGLVPDVEIVPRGTYSWGSAGRSSAGCNKSGKTVLAPSPPVSSWARDNGARVQTKFGSNNEVGGLAERYSQPSSTESGCTPPSSAGGNKSEGTSIATSCSVSTGAWNSGPKVHIGSASGSDAGGLAQNLIRSSSTGSRTSPSFAPVNTTQAWDSTAKLEEQGQSSGFTSDPAKSWTQASDKVSNLQPHQQSGGGYGRAGRESQGFGFYGNYPPFFRSGVPPSDSQGMAFEPGMYPNSSRHDGFHNSPGVPYYSSMDDKEIVLITMVGNPGFYGSYLLHPGYPEQYGRPEMHRDFPLQFGHFEQFVGVPGHGMLDGGSQVPAAISSTFLGEQPEFVCYEQECYQEACHKLGSCKDGWMRGSSRDGDVQRDVHEVQIPTSVSAFKTRSNPEKHSMPKKTGRQRSAYCNGKVVSTVALPAVPAPERRVTLLTKVSRHEVLINSSQKESEDGGGGFARGPFSSPFAVKEVPEGEYECKPETVLTEICDAGKVVGDADIKRSDAAVVSKRQKTAREIIFPQGTGMETNREFSTPATSCNKECLPCEVQTGALEASSTLVSEAHGKTAVHEIIPSALPCSGPIKKVPATSIKKLNGVIRPTVEVKHVILEANIYNTKNATKGQEGASLNSSLDSAAAFEQVINVETLNSTTIENPPSLINQKGKRMPRNHKSSKWRHKWPAGEVKLGRKVFVPKIHKALKHSNMSKNSPSECDILSHPSASCKMGADLTTLSTQSSQKAAVKTNLHGETSSLSSSASGAVSAVKPCAFLNEKLYGATSLDCTASDGHSQNRKGERFHKDASHSGCHDTVAVVDPVKSQESSKKTAIEDMSSMINHKQKVKGAYLRCEKEWRPKLDAAIHAKSATKASGLQARKAHGVPKVSGLEVSKAHVALSSTTSTDSKNSSEVFYYDDLKKKFKQKTNSYKHPHGDSLSFAMDELLTDGNMPLNLVTKTESNKGEKAKELQSSETSSSRNKGVENEGNTLRPIGKQKLQQQKSMAHKHDDWKQMHKGDIRMREGQASPVHGLEIHQSSRPVDPKSGIEYKISNDAKHSPSKQDSQVVPGLQFEEGYKEHEHASHVGHSPYPEEGFKGHDHAPSAPQFGKFQKARNNESYPISRMQQQKQLHARDISLAEEQPALSHSSVLEQSEGSSTFPDAKSGTENKPCRKLKEGAWQGLKKLSEGQILKVASLSNTKGSEKDHATPTVQMKKAPEEFPVAPSSNFVPSAPRFRNGLQVGTVAKQSHKSVLEMQHSAVLQQTRQASLLLEKQVGLVPSQQFTGSLASLSGCEDNMASKIVKNGRYFISWRPKIVGENFASREAVIKEVNENDPLTCAHVKGSSKKRTHLPTASQAAATSDLCMWRNNGRHSVRALYGLPSRQRDHPQP